MKTLVTTEPVAFWAAVALVIVTLAGQFGVVIDLSVVENVLLAIPIIVSAVIARSKVSPVATLPVAKR